MKTEEKKLTGYPSIDKPWLKYYSKETMNAEFPACTVYQNIYEHNKGHLEDIALEYFGTRMTYRKLFEEIEKAVAAFVSYGVEKGDRVILFTSSTPEIVSAVLALSKIGAVANMINPLFEEEQIVARINETEATLMIAMEQLWPKVEKIVDKLCIKKYVIVSVTDAMPPIKKHVARLKSKVNISYSEKIVTWKTFIEQYSKQSKNVLSTYERDLPFVMVYSSGTTGASKGIVLTNDGINATISHYLSPGFPYERGNRFLQIVPVWFSTGMVVTLLMPLCLGITVILEPVFSKESFAADVKKYKPNMTLAATSLWLYIMKCEELKNVDLSFLNYPITGGEQTLPRVELDLNEFLQEHGCKTHMLKGWGMCELGGTVSSDSLTCVKPDATGYPILDVTVAAFDPDTNREMQYNKRGELRVQSPCRMKEYFKNPDATNTYFWKDDNGSIWGCTGDIGYVDEDGFVYVLGRVGDNFIPSSGRSIYCFDVETVILENSNIAQCEVVGLKTGSGFDIPVAHLILKEECTLSKSELIRQVHDSCVKKLSSDAVPSGYKICNTFPVKVTGKRNMELIKADRDGFVTIRQGQLVETAFD